MTRAQSATVSPESSTASASALRTVERARNNLSKPARGHLTRRQPTLPSLLSTKFFKRSKLV